MIKIKQSNVEYTIFTSKRRIGSFAVKGWISGRNYSTMAARPSSTQNLDMDPWFLTGFSDAEGHFFVNLAKNPQSAHGYRVTLGFTIGLHSKNLELLKLIKAFLDEKGSITKLGKESLQYRVFSLKDLETVIEHFDKYPLITQKKADYMLFKQAYGLVKCKKHLTVEGLKEIVAIKSSMNRGLSEELKAGFPNIFPVPRPSVIDYKIQDPNWLAGFTSGEGCFYVSIAKNSKYTSGAQVKLVFKITQQGVPPSRYCINGKFNKIFRLWKLFTIFKHRLPKGRWWFLCQ